MKFNVFNIIWYLLHTENTCSFTNALFLIQQFTTDHINPIPNQPAFDHIP
jgi:hypothetical protein